MAKANEKEKVQTDQLEKKIFPGTAETQFGISFDLICSLRDIWKSNDRIQRRSLVKDFTSDVRLPPSFL